MPILTNLRYGLKVLNRFLNVFIVMPASCGVFIFAMTNGFSFDEMARSAFLYFRELPPSVLVDAWAHEAAAQVSFLYWMLVFFGLFTNIMVMGPREFFMMHEPDQAEASGSSL